MAKRDTGTDDLRVKVRPGKSSRPRTKRRPDYSERPLGRVVAVDRGRFAVSIEDGPTVQAVKARELPRGSVVIGDRVRLTGDLSGVPDTLARIAAVEPRKNVLRRSLEEADEGRGEKIIVANADLLVIVAAAANPAPRVGMVDRCLVAAEEAGIPALLCITKTDLADPGDFAKNFVHFDLEILTVDALDGSGVSELETRLTGLFSVMIGHSGVGKSTLINALVPSSDRVVGEVSLLTGKGRHTSTSAVALPLPRGGWLVDTPGVRSFGLAHAQVDEVLAVFPELERATSYCLPNCTHLATESSCALAEWVDSTGPFKDGNEDAAELSPEVRQNVVDRARALIEGMQKLSWQ